MKWIVIFWLPFVTGCRMAKFVTEEGVTLENHVITTVLAADPIKCRWDCVDKPLCFSVNVRKLEPGGRVTCELNSSSKTADPQDLVPSAGTQYHQMAEVEHCTAEQCIYKDALADGWYRFGSKLLKPFPDGKAWDKAALSCQSIGGELVSINNEDENEFVSHLLDQIETNTAGNSLAADIVNHWILDGTDSDVSLVDGARYEEEDGVKSLYLDGSGSHAITPAVDFGAIGSFTITSWVKLQGLTLHPSPIYSYWDSFQGQAHFLFDVHANGKLHFMVNNSQGTFEPSVNEGASPIDEWFHAAVAWKKSSKEVCLFIDGQEVGKASVPSYITFRDDFPLFYDIGHMRDLASESLKGYLRDLMIFGRDLTGNELSTMADPFGGVWIGLNDINSEGTFHWPNGIHVTYTKWASTLSHNQNENHDCVRMTVNKGAWDDTSCEKVLPFVCEKKG